MVRYEPQTELSTELRALADELLEGVGLPTMLRPWVEGALDGYLRRVDADPEAARTQLRPLIARAAAAVGLTLAWDEAS